MSLLVLFLSSALAAGPERPSLEAIHAPDRYFTADEFRQHLEWMRGQEALTDAFNDPSLTTDQQKKLGDFARRLLEKSENGTDKKDLNIPQELLRNPQVQKLLEDDQFLHWIADNPGMQKLAENFAEKYNIPDLPQFRSRPPISLGPTGGPAGRPGQGNAPWSEKEDEWSTGNEPANAPPTGNGQAGTNPRQREEAAASPPANEGNAGATSQGAEGGGFPNTGAGGQTEPDAGTGEPPRHAILRELTDSMRHIEPLKNSPTLNRIDDLLGKAQASGGSSLVERALPSEDWVNRHVVDPWMNSSWSNNLPQSLGEIPLPPGWQAVTPSLDKFPLPRFPAIDAAFPIAGPPRIPSFGLDSGQSLSGKSLAVPIIAMLAVVVVIVLIRSLTSQGMLQRMLGHAHAGARVHRPTHPLDASRRDSIREWFEYLAFLRLGTEASHQTHAQLAESLARSEAESASAQRLAHLYEEARYLPPDEPVDRELASHATEDVERLTTSQPTP